jgi:two-component system, NarL family, invasion response regulator UvrY
MVKILLADDHAVIRAGLKEYISNILPHSLIEETGDGDTVFEKMKGHNYDLIILEINMPNTDSFDVVRNILAKKPRSKILIFSMKPEEQYAKRYLELGALGYLNKGALADEIGRAVRNVLDHKRYISPSLTRSLAEGALYKNADSQNPFDWLSPREIEITRHLLKGETVSQIGSLLGLHTSTVGTHKGRIFEKLSCKNILALIELAVMHHFNATG